MNNFSYKEPYLYRDESNKKWCIRYSIKYNGQKNYTALKEYGRTYFGKSLNSIDDLKLREKEFQKLLLLVEMDLKKGIDIKRPETIVAIYQEEIKAAKKHSYDENYQLYLKMKGLINPIPKKEMTAVAYSSFHKNQLRPFLEKKGLLDDITRISKTDMLEFMNFYYLNADPKLKWTNNTFNNKKGYLSSFFETLVEEEILKENPVTKIKNKPSEATERFAIFTKEERDLLFEYFDNGKHPFMAAICRLMYYAFIRETELSRLKVGDFDLDKRQICIQANIAKGQKDNLVRWVKMTLPLQEALRSYLSKYEYKPDWYMFGKKYRPSEYQVNHWWQYLFRDGLAELKTQHPDKFNRKGLSPYSLKHSGVTDFINDNKSKFSTTELYSYVQKQCRHEKFEMTQKYLKKLEINIDEIDLFDFI